MVWKARKATSWKSMEDCVKNKIFLHFDDGKNRGGQKMCGVYLPKLFAWLWTESDWNTFFIYWKDQNYHFFTLFMFFIWEFLYHLTACIDLFSLTFYTIKQEERKVLIFFSFLFFLYQITKKHSFSTLFSFPLIAFFLKPNKAYILLIQWEFKTMI